ncbi:zinc-binding dehydrogenase [Streptomyces tendae]|uniref:zinc-binding dehydrogenase n=1 Tax=Streptomyces tendae TaxID=1932 RepID=UPI003660A7D7
MSSVVETEGTMPDSATTMVVTEPRGPLHPEAAEIVSPQAGRVRVSVVASGVCNADIGTAAATGENGCAGVTAFNAIRKAGIRAGGRVAVFGIGGLGHLAVQFAAALGYETVAIARGGDREQRARDLGAHEYIDSAAQAPGAALKELGGADLIVHTASSTAPVDELLTGLAAHGQLTLVGVDAGSLTVPAVRLVMNGHTLTGHLTGSPRETEEAMAFAVTTGVRPVIERMPLEQAGEAVTRLRSGAPRFRIVLGTAVSGG